MATKKGKAKPPKGYTEFEFRIDAYTPETMPLDRLAAYMAELATILGEPKSVHLMTVKPGSTAPQFRIDREADPKVRRNLELVGRGEARPDVLASVKIVNRMLRDDAAVASFTEVGRKRPLFVFPGRDEKLAQEVVVEQPTTIAGELMRVGGKDKSQHALLVVEGKTISRLNMNRPMAKQLAQHLFEHVRLSGDGKWLRDAEGEWVLVQLEVHDFKVLKWEPLNVALKDLRGSGFRPEGKNLFEEMSELRHGKRGDDVRH